VETSEGTDQGVGELELFRFVPVSNLHNEDLGLSALFHTTPAFSCTGHAREDRHDSVTVGVCEPFLEHICVFSFLVSGRVSVTIHQVTLLFPRHLEVFLSPLEGIFEEIEESILAHIDLINKGLTSVDVIFWLFANNTLAVVSMLLHPHGLSLELLNSSLVYWGKDKDFGDGSVRLGLGEIVILDHLNLNSVSDATFEKSLVVLSGLHLASLGVEFALAHLPSFTVFDLRSEHLFKLIYGSSVRDVSEIEQSGMVHTISSLIALEDQLHHEVGVQGHIFGFPH